MTPIYRIDPATGTALVLSAADLSENGPIRLKQFEEYAATSARVLHVATAASVALGLLILRILAERLYEHLGVPADSAGATRPMTSAEYLANLRERLNLSAATMSRARAAANIFETLARAGVTPPLVRAHIMPLRDAEIADVVQIYTRAVAKHGDALTEALVAEEVANHYGRPKKKAESSFAALKRKVADLVNETLRCLELDNRDAANETLRKLLAIAAAQPATRRKSAALVRARKTNRENGISSSAPKVKPKALESDFVQHSIAMQATTNPIPLVGGGARATGREEPRVSEQIVGTTTIWTEGNWVFAKNAPFDSHSRPASIAILRAAEFDYEKPAKVWWKKYASLAETTRACDLLIQALNDALQSKS